MGLTTQEFKEFLEFDESHHQEIRIILNQLDFAHFSKLNKSYEAHINKIVNKENAHYFNELHNSDLNSFKSEVNKYFFEFTLLQDIDINIFENKYYEVLIHSKYYEHFIDRIVFYLS